VIAVPRRGGRAVAQPLEAAQVELVGPDEDAVARWPRLDEARIEHPAQLGHLPVDLGHRGGRRRGAVERLGDALDGDDAVGVQEQQREHRPLPRPAERDLLAAAPDLQRPQDGELGHVALPAAIG
jgi:hypothetical protein